MESEPARHAPSFVYRIVKERDENGNGLLHGAHGHIFRTKHKKSILTTGSLCKIKLCRDIGATKEEEPQQFFAIKRFNKLTLKKRKQYLRKPDGTGMRIYSQLDAVRKEIAMMAQINHPNCIKMHQVIEDVPKREQVYVNEVYKAKGKDIIRPDSLDSESDEDEGPLSEKLYMILELARHREVMTWNTNEYRFLPNPALVPQGQEFIPQATLVKILRDCLKGLQYLHEQARIVHRDIKPQNVLASEGEHGLVFKLCDFGVSEPLPPDSPMLSKTAGTYHFFPPECCDPEVEAFDGKAVDVWSLGATLFCLTFNELPFWDADNCENEFAILDYILKNDVVLPAESGRTIVKEFNGEEGAVSEEMMDLMLRMLSKDVQKRATVEQLLSHPLLLETQN